MMREDEGEAPQASRLDAKGRHREGLGHRPEDGYPQHHAEVGDARYDEGLHGRLHGTLATSDRDEAEEGEQQALPEEQHHGQVVREYCPVHLGEGDEEVGVVLVPFLLALHEGEGVESDEEPEARGGEEDEAREAIEPEGEVYPPGGGPGVGEARRLAEKEDREAEVGRDGDGARDLLAEAQPLRQEEAGDAEEGRYDYRKEEKGGVHRSPPAKATIAPWTKSEGKAMRRPLASERAARKTTLPTIPGVPSRGALIFSSPMKTIAKSLNR